MQEATQDIIEATEQAERLRAQLERIELLYTKLLPLALPTILNNITAAVHNNDRAVIEEQVSYLTR